MKKILCSACLLGINCKYDGGNNANQKVLELAKKEILIPLCPEQLGGLPTPRPRSGRRGNRVINEFGDDMTEAFARGAKERLRVAKLLGINEAILKQCSPSCGCGQIYADFEGTITDGYGITAELLKNNGIKIISEERL